ncbi:hypothetical protein OAK45_04120 [Verrucomicrobia bacterium]|nr:hypothetical protein [Verrucomicrobiota bacterium]
MDKQDLNNWTFQTLDTSGWVLPFCLLVMAVTVWVSWSNWHRRGSKGVAALETLRVVIMALILFTLCRPEFISVTQTEDQPEVVILKDVSSSMTTRDVKLGQHDVITREEWLAEQIKTNFWRTLEGKAIVHVQDFGMSATNAVTGIADGTDVANALNLTRTRWNQKNLKAIFMLGDGDWNFGDPPQQAAMRLGAKDPPVPVYTLAVGSDRAQKDLVLESVNPPTFGLLGGQISIPFRVRSHLPVAVKTQVRLTSSRGAAVSIAKQITVPAFGQVHDSLVWAPHDLGDYTLTLTLPVWQSGLEKELLEDNNRQTFHLSVRTEKLNVLVVESYPRWEYRYLRNALTRDPGVELSVLLLHPELGPGTGDDYIGRFPDTREQLSRFDVVFLGDVGLGEKELTKEQCELLRGLVEQQGSGLVFLPGQRGRHHSLIDQPIGELMPVTLSPTNKEGYYIPSESHFKLTSTGRGHFLTMLKADEGLNEAIWKTLPGFFWCAPVERSRPGSTVLATHSTKRNQYGYLPLLVTRPSPSLAGEVLFMGTDAAWRWRRGVEDLYHYRFWGQVVRWMAHKRKMAQGQGMRLTFSPENPKVGDEMFLQATMLDLSGGTTASDLRARIAAPDGSTSDLEFTAIEGGWGVFKTKMTVPQGGTYSLELYNPSGSQKLNAEIIVDKPTLEKIGQPANAKVFSEISQRTGGQSGGIADLQKLISQISVVAENEEKTHIYPLWSKPWWGGIMLLLLVVYWVSRKVLGMI